MAGRTVSSRRLRPFWRPTASMPLSCFQMLALVGARLPALDHALFSDKTLTSFACEPTESCELHYRSETALLLS